MNTAILVGGDEQSAPTHFGDRLVREIAMRVKQPKILSCNFAKADEAERSKSTEAWLQWFGEYFPGCKITVADEEEFYEQVAVHDIIYLHGGRTQTLLDALPNFAKSRDAFRDKIVIGSSAGANYLTHGGYSPKGGDYVEGIGLANVSTLIHYGARDKATMDEWRILVRKVEERFHQAVICLSEGEFVVVETA